MQIDYKIVGRNIRRFRKQRELSQATFAEMIEKSTSYVSYIENGHKSLSLQTFVQIANALEISTDTLLAEYLQSSNYFRDQGVLQTLSQCSAQERTIVVDTMIGLLQSLRKNSLYHSCGSGVAKGCDSGRGDL